MKRKRIGSIFMAAVLMAVSLAATPLVAHAEDHINPKTSKPCNNTYYVVSHTGFSHSYAVEKERHQLSDGTYCIPTRLVFIHQKNCSSCTAVLQTSWYFQCEEWHSECGTVIRGQGH